MVDAHSFLEVDFPHPSPVNELACLLLAIEAVDHRLGDLLFAASVGVDEVLAFEAPTYLPRLMSIKELWRRLRLQLALSPDASVHLDSGKALIW